MTPTEYTALCTFLRTKSGIVLGEKKEYLVESRLQHVAKQHGFSTVDELVGKLSILPLAAQNDIIDAMTTNESFFFRDNTPFRQFEETMLPALHSARKAKGSLRIWCAAASTGQEPYSLAMLLMSKKRLWAGLNVEIVATDLSDVALDRARAGSYSQFEVQRGLPVQMLVEHFTQEGTNWVISDEIKKMVQFSKLNLLDPLSRIGVVDVVFCRNVLIYFDVETKKKVLEAVHRNMASDGYLVLGAAETLMGITDVLQRCDGERGLYQPNVAAKRMTA